MAKNIKYIFYLLCLLNVGIILYYFNARDAFHVDEQLSYAHANSTQGAYLSPTINSYMKDYGNDISYKWLNGQIFHNYLTVQENERFSYRHITENLKMDVHPPLYFILLHTVSSFFPDVFSKWHGGILNIIFFIVTLIMLYKLSRLFFDDNIIAMFPVFLWGFSTAGLATAMYIRMYMLQTLWAVCLVYETLKMLRDEGSYKKRLFLIFLYSALGVGTQYNSLFFSFFVALVTSFVLLLQKKWRLLWAYGLVMLCSAGVLFIVFPEAFDVLLFSYRGEEARRTLDIQRMSLLLLEEKMGVLRDAYLMQLLSFREIYSYIGVVFILLLTLNFYAPKQNKNILWLGLISLLFAVGMSVLMPEMFEFGLRYTMCIMPFAAILTIYLLIQGGKALEIKKNYLVVLAGCLVLINSVLTDFGKRSVFSFQSEAKTVELLNEMRGKKILAVSRVDAFFNGVYFYKDSERVFRSDNLCERKDILDEADYILVYHSMARKKDEIKERSSRECAEGLEFVAIISLYSQNFEVYRGKSSN